MKRNEQTGMMMLREWFEGIYRRKTKSGSWGLMNTVIMLPTHIQHALMKDQIIPSQTSYRTHFTVDVTNASLSFEGQTLVAIAAEEPAMA